MPDTVWDRLEPVLVGAGVKRIRNLRLRIEGVLWRLRTGAPWRDLPTELGSWSTVFSFFNRWSQKGLWRKVFELLRGELDDEWSFIDSSYVKVHQHAAGAAGTTKEKVSRRKHFETPYPMRCSRKSGPVLAHSGQCQRFHDGRPTSQGLPSAIGHGGQGIRFEQGKKNHRRERIHSRDSDERGQPSTQSPLR